MNNKKVIESFNMVCLMHFSIVMKRLLFSTNGSRELVTEDRWNRRSLLGIITHSSISVPTIMTCSF